MTKKAIKAVSKSGRVFRRVTSKAYKAAYAVTVDGGATVIDVGFRMDREAAERDAVREVNRQLKGDFGDTKGLFKDRGLSYEVMNVISDIGVEGIQAWAANITGLLDR
jgi:hypothetical protein